jgi:pimeloyl-ACP methyl ester carboxylesterase/heat shock protein HslJ
MKTTLMTALLASLLLLAACGGAQTPAPTAEAPATAAPATAVPATEVPATEVPATEVPATEAPAAPAAVPPPTEELVMLRANPWQWVSFTGATEAFDVEAPASYTATFNPDATLAIVADCNNAAGSYQGEGGKLSIEIGPMTAAACPPDSRSDQFVKLLGGAALYYFRDGNLYIDLFADGGTMVFAPAAAEVTSEVGTGAFGDAWEAVGCDTLSVRPEIAELADCGYVTVPENRAAGTDKMIQLAVVRIRSTAETPGAPVILGTGGPGSDGLGRLKLDPAFLASRVGILEDRDWIGFTQRGTVGAIPALTCPALDRVALDSAGQGLTPEESIDLRKTTLQACLDQVAAAGVDLTGYNSVENASDVVAVMDALGYDKFFYYGQSYGTLLGQYLLKDHGDRLAGIILDGIAPATHTSWPDITDMPAAFRRVFDACAADAACAAAYPEAEAALEAGLQALDATLPSLTAPTAEGALTVTVNSTLAMHAIFGSLYVRFGALPWLANELRDGNVAPLAGDIETFLSPDSSAATLMHLAVVCSDDPLLAMDDLSMEGVPPMYQGLREDDALQYGTACPILALPQLPASYDTLVASELPALLLQGGMDPATGVPVGSTVQEGLPNSTNVIVPAGSHIVGNSPCGIAIMDAFMSDPAATPDTSCVDPAIPFAVPGPVSISNADGSVTLGITLPGGLGSMAPGFWQSPDIAVALQVFDAGTTAEDAINQLLTALAVEAEGEFVDGPAIAGLPSRMAKAFHPAGGDMEIYGFADERGAYRVVIGVMNPSATEDVRQNRQPVLQESVTLDGE